MEDWLSQAPPITTILGAVDPRLCTQPQAPHRNVNLASARAALPRLGGLEWGGGGRRIGGAKGSHVPEPWGCPSSCLFTQLTMEATSTPHPRRAVRQSSLKSSHQQAPSGAGPQRPGGGGGCSWSSVLPDPTVPNPHLPSEAQGDPQGSPGHCPLQGCSLPGVSPTPADSCPT